MKKKILTHGIMSVFVAQALMGCVEEPETQVSVFGSVQECMLAGNLKDECEDAWKHTQQANSTMAPRFTDTQACEDEFGTGQCSVQRVQNDDGSWSDVLIPAMAGMMIGSMLSGSGSSNIQPMYQTKEEKERKRTSGVGYVPQYSTNQGAMISSGKSTVKQSFVTPAKPSSTPIARGGFGKAGAASVGG